MPHRLRWIERRFAFDLPLSMVPCVLERLRGTPALRMGFYRRCSGAYWIVGVKDGIAD